MNERTESITIPLVYVHNRFTFDRRAITFIYCEPWNLFAHHDCAENYLFIEIMQAVKKSRICDPLHLLELNSCSVALYDSGRPATTREPPPQEHPSIEWFWSSSPTDSDDDCRLLSFRRHWSIAPSQLISSTTPQPHPPFPQLKSLRTFVVLSHTLPTFHGGDEEPRILLLHARWWSLYSCIKHTISCSPRWQDHKNVTTAAALHRTWMMSHTGSAALEKGTRH